MKIKLNNTRTNPNIPVMVLKILDCKSPKLVRREYKMNATASKSVLGQMPAVAAPAVAPATSAKALSTLLLAAGVAALVVTTDQMIDDWAETHVLASWLALWGVAVLAIAALRGVTRLLAQKLMARLMFGRPIWRTAALTSACGPWPKTTAASCATCKPPWTVPRTAAPPPRMCTP